VNSTDIFDDKEYPVLSRYIKLLLTEEEKTKMKNGSIELKLENKKEIGK
jgi:hypothetical protein